MGLDEPPQGLGVRPVEMADTRVHGPHGAHRVHRREVEALADGGAEVFLLGERGKYPPFGVAGGGSAVLNRFVYETDNGEATPPLVSKVTDVKIRRGQKVRLETPGGGGFGDPAQRDPTRVARDVRLGYVSRLAALDSYKTVLRDDGSLDADATAKVRGNR